MEEAYFVRIKNKKCIGIKLKFGVRCEIKVLFLR